MAKTPEYTKKAIANYNAKFDRVQVNLPKGTKERIKAVTGLSCNAFLNEIIENELRKRELDQMQPVQEKNINTFPDDNDLPFN